MAGLDPSCVRYLHDLLILFQSNKLHALALALAWRSLSLSKADVASSSSRIGGSLMMARAIAIRCFRFFFFQHHHTERPQAKNETFFERIDCTAVEEGN